MANGSFKSSEYTGAGIGYGRYVEVVWKSTNDTANNKSTITWTAYIRSSDSSATKYVYAKNIVVTINEIETTVIGSTAQKTYKGDNLGSGTIIVSHGSNGKKSVNVSIDAEFYTYGTSNSKYTGSITMSSNPVYTLSMSAGAGSSIIVNRTSCAGVGSGGNLSAGEKKLCHGDKLKITFTPSTNYSINAHTVNGNTFTSGNTYTVSGNVAVVATATPLKSAIGATDANIESTSTITVTKYNSSYTHTITYKLGEATGTIATKSSNTSIAWTVPADFYAQIPNAKTGTCTLTCETFNGNTSLGSTTCTLTVTAASNKCAPIVTATVVDTNETTKALTGDESTLIRYRSTALCTLDATPNNSAAISSLVIAGNTVTGTTNNGVTTATKSFSSVSTTSFSFVAKDSRGHSTTVSKNPIMIAYTNLTCNPVLSRPTTTSSSIEMTFTGDFFRGSFGACSNTLTIQYRYRDFENVSWSDWQDIESENIELEISSYKSKGAITLGDEFDYQKGYLFQVRAIDGGTVGNTFYALSTLTKTITVKRGVPVFDWGENDFNVNVPLMLNNTNILNIMYPVGAVYMHSGSALPTAILNIGTWESVASSITDIYAWKRTE